MFQPAWDVVCDNNVSGRTASSVCDRDCVVDRISRTNFLGPALLARQDRLCAEQGAESYRDGCAAEAGTELAFAFTVYPYFGGNAFTFSQGTKFPGEFAAIYLRWRITSKKVYTIR
jgi:hypothetical protein